jgi:PAS domain-containing protein
MTVNTPPPRNELGLRRSAEERLRLGTAPPNRGWTTSGDALACLHQLASKQSSAADALKFLHELQVYQVELDLQYEQLEQNRAELAEQLEQHVELFDRVAVGLLITDADGMISEANPRAASLLHADLDNLPGRRIGSFIQAASRPALVNALARLNAGTEERSCVVHRDADGNVGAALRLTATRSRDGRSRLVALVEVTPQEPPARG